MDNNEVICSCSGVTVGMLKDAITNGADTVYWKNQNKRQLFLKFSPN